MIESGFIYQIVLLSRPYVKPKRVKYTEYTTGETENIWLAVSYLIGSSHWLLHLAYTETPILEAKTPEHTIKLKSTTP